MAQQSLYERLGGVNAIAMVVDRFSDTIIDNPKLNVNPALKEWNTKGEVGHLRLGKEPRARGDGCGLADPQPARCRRWAALSSR